MIVFKRINVRLYPTVKQKEILDLHFNAYRFCYNLCLNYRSVMWSDYKINKSGYDMRKELFVIRKETKWLSKCKSECIGEAALNVEKSFKSFLKGRGYPNFKSKNSNQSFTAYRGISVKNGCIKFYGHKLKVSSSVRDILTLEKSEIKNCVFKKDKCGDYWASCLISSSVNQLPKITSSVGIDLGIKELIVTSDNDVYKNKKYLISSRFKLIKLQRRFAKTIKGGKNRIKLGIKISRINRTLTNQKKHYYHQITNQLIRENQTIVVESLNISGMLKNHKIARNISDASWSVLLHQLEYKCQWYGRDLIKIDRWFPSSKTCSGCGNVKDVLSLGTRTYDCECCGLSIDRDLNAAINIRNAGLKIPEVPMEDAVNGQADEVGNKRKLLQL